MAENNSDQYIVHKLPTEKKGKSLMDTRGLLRKWASINFQSDSLGDTIYIKKEIISLCLEGCFCGGFSPVEKSYHFPFNCFQLSLE